METQQPNEVWKDIQGYEGLYQVSSFGRVRSLDRLIKSRYGNSRRIAGKIIKPNKIWSGYLRISLWREQKTEYKSVHRLVAETFIPNPENFPCVNHKDEVKSNNAVSNLEWCTWKYNANYGTRNERFSKKRMNCPSISKSVIQYLKDGTVISEFESAKEAERQTGINNANIISCCIGRKSFHTAGGYKWKYANE